MIKLHFEALQTQQSITVGPAAGFRVAGNFLRRLPGNDVIGEYSRHQWHVRSGHFSKYECREPFVLHFADLEGTPSETFGPYTLLQVADGTVYVGDRLFAKFIDETLLWHSFELENYWPNLIVESPHAVASGAGE